PVDTATALPTAGFPRVIGTVLTALPDGAGGWYIAGQFTAVGGVSRTNIARVLANNTVATWNPGANGIVRAMVLRAGLVYVGGDFGVIGGAARNRITAIDVTTGVATAWNPNANSSVRAFAANASVL